VQMHVCLFCLCFNPPSIFLNFLSPASSHLMKWDTSSHSHHLHARLRFSGLSFIIIRMQMKWILLFTPSYCSCLSAWGPFERSNDFLRLLHVNFPHFLMNIDDACLNYTIPHCCEFIPLTKCFFTDVFHPALLVI